MACQLPCKWLPSERTMRISAQLTNWMRIKGSQASTGLWGLPLRRAAQTVARQGRAPHGTSPLRCGGGGVDWRHYSTYGRDARRRLGSGPVLLLPLPTRYQGCLLYTSDAADEPTRTVIGSRCNLKCYKTFTTWFFFTRCISTIRLGHNRIEAIC